LFYSKIMKELTWSVIVGVGLEAGRPPSVMRSSPA
jgi:hypothetical protein